MSIRDKRLWTFVLRGGVAFKLAPKGNLPMEHDGTKSLLKAVLTERRAEETARLIEGYGCEVEFHTEREDDEQKAVRRRLAGVLRDEQVFPTPKCPGCAFFDVLDARYCGVVMWPKEAVWSLLDRLPEKAKSDLQQCPQKRGKEFLDDE